MSTPDPTPIPLWSNDAECAVISTIVNNGAAALDLAIDLVQEDWFFVPANKAAFQTLKEMGARRQPIDLVTFTEALRQAGHLDKLDGGPGYVATEWSRTSGILSTLEHWSEQVRDYWRRREAANLARELLDQARNFQDSTNDILDAFEKCLLELRRDTKEVGLVHCAEAIDEALANIEAHYKNKGAVLGLTTGFVDLDRTTDGLHGGQLIIVAARPSMGKSAFALNIAEHVCTRNNHPVALFTLEMPKVDLMKRLLCSVANLDLGVTKTGFLNKEQAARLMDVSVELSGAQLYLDNTPALNIAAFRSRARRAVHRNGVKLLIVDYLQLMKGVSKRASQDRRLEIDEISSGLKAVAMELNVPVLALAQLNRSADEASVPKISHLRESGGIENDADVVALLHRPERLTKDPDKLADLKGKAFLYIEKNRNGGTGDIELHFDGPRYRFTGVTQKLYSNNQAERQQKRPAPSSPRYKPNNFNDTDGD
jgi:replicative DNA helicase